MDRGLYPTYFLHLEKDYGKKVFLLAGKYNVYYLFRDWLHIFWERNTKMPSFTLPYNSLPIIFFAYSYFIPGIFIEAITFH